MLDMSSPDDVVLMAAIIIDFVRHIGHAPFLYLAAALVARFCHRHMWVIYLGFAVAAILDPR